jgi:hypothetical protein
VISSSARNTRSSKAACPARVDGEGDGQGKERGEDRADEGHEAQKRGEDAPEQSVRHADEIQPDADQRAEGGVDDEVHQQVAADPLAGVAQRLARRRYVRSTHQADKAIAHVVASIKIRTTNRITRPAVAIGPSSGPAMSPITRNGEDSGSSIRTGSGCWRGVAPCPAKLPAPDRRIRWQAGETP